MPKDAARSDDQPAAVDVASVMNSLRRVVRAFRAAAQEAEDVLNISGAQHFVLQRLAESESVTLEELASRTMTRKSSVSAVVARLTERGLVARREQQGSEGGVIVAITSEGRKALARLPDSAQARTVEALKRMSKRDIAFFALLFERFTEGLGVRGLEPTMLFESEPPKRSRSTRAREP